MEGYSRDLLCGIGGGDGPHREQKPRLDLETEEVELSLGLSLGGRFGLERREENLSRSSSVASILTPEEAPPALARTSSLPAKAGPEVGKNQRPDDWSGCRGKSVEVEPATRLLGSGSPSSGSSDGEGQRLEDTLMRTSSLPAGIEDEWRKRKEAQSLKRLEVKRKRIERRNSLTSKEAAGQILEEMNARVEKVESYNDVAMGNKQIRGNLNHSNDKHHSNGLPPTHQAKFTSQDSSLSGMPKMQKSATKGTPNAEEHTLSPAVPPPTEGANGTIIATPSSSALAARAAALGSRGEQHHISGKLAARAKSMGDVERIMMQEMPCVCTKGLPNGKRVEGFLYKYRKGEEVRIVCVCHGSFLTPAEFVKHAGGSDVANPLRHIVVNPIPPSFF